jgi:hypothetical protein
VWTVFKTDHCKTQNEPFGILCLAGAIRTCNADSRRLSGNLKILLSLEKTETITGRHNKHTKFTTDLDIWKKAEQDFHERLNALRTFETVYFLIADRFRSWARKQKSETATQGYTQPRICKRRRHTKCRSVKQPDHRSNHIHPNPSHVFAVCRLSTA